MTEEESLSGFSNTQLFERLFYQRDEPDTALLQAAEVLALVYSFSTSANEGGVDELDTLAGLLGQHRRVLYRAAQTLVNRQLAQKRGNWRAILPHVVSNWLARRALENIPVDDILNTFQGLPSPRLLKSFGKRLGYLHDHEAAQDIVKSWLSPGGLLRALHLLNEDNIQLLLNVAPAVPEDVLRALEAQGKTFFSRGNPHFSTFVYLLSKIAYEAELFERCVNLLAKFALTEKEGENRDSIQERLFDLFSLYLSGTEANPDAREDFARRFLMSDNPNEQRLGLGMLRAALQSYHWFAVGNFEFGARPRSYGYHPGTSQEQDQWFIRFIALAQERATGDVRLSPQVRSLLAGEFQGLWRYPGLRTTLTDLATALNEQRPWLEGWHAIQEIKHCNDLNADGETAPDSAELLDKLDGMLKPKRLSDEIRAYVLSAGYELFVEESSRKRIAHDLGTVVTSEPQVLDELLQDFFTAEFGCLIEFGTGMASACSDLQALWGRLVEGLERVDDQARHCGVLEGVLKVIHQHDEPLAQKILDEAVQNRSLRKFIVDLQVSVPLDHIGIGRLHQSLGFDDTPLRQFEKLAWHRLPDIFNEADIRNLMLSVLGRPDGFRVVLSGLSLRVRMLKDDNLTLGPDLKRVGLLASAALLHHKVDYYGGGSTDYRLSEVLKSCLDEVEFPEETNKVFDAYFTQLRKSYGCMIGREKVVAVLAEKATFRFLDGIFLDPALRNYCHTIFREDRDEKNSLSGVSVMTLLDWCGQGDFQERLLMISEAIYPFEKEPEGDGVVLSEQAHAIIGATQDPSTVLGNLCSSVYPSGWSGSLANIIAKRGQAFKPLLEHSRSDIRDAATTQIARISQWEDRERQQERAEDEQREQRFE